MSNRNGIATQRRVFISHSSADAEWVRRLATDLRANGVYAWLDVWDMPPGKPLSDAMQDGIQSAHDMLLVMTPASMSSIRAGTGGVAFEVHVGEGRRFRDRSFRIIGIYREQCDAPEKLRNRIGRWLDFTDDKEYSDRLKELVAWLEGRRLGPPIASPDKVAGYRFQAQRTIARLRSLSLDLAIDEEGNGLAEVPLLRVTHEKGDNTKLLKAPVSLTDALGSGKPLLIFGAGGEGKTLLATRIAQDWLTTDGPIPYLTTAEEINRGAERTVKHERKHLYEYLCSASGLHDIALTDPRSRFGFLIDDYHELNSDLRSQLRQAIQRLTSANHLIVLLARKDYGGSNKGDDLFDVVEIDSETIARELKDFAKKRVPIHRESDFQDYASQYDASVLGRFLTKWFLTVIFREHSTDDSAILPYLTDPMCVSAVSQGTPLSRVQLYDALTDYLTGRDLYRENSSLSDEDIRELIARRKDELSHMAFDALLSSASVESG